LHPKNYLPGASMLTVARLQPYITTDKNPWFPGWTLILDNEIGPDGRLAAVGEGRPPARVATARAHRTAPIVRPRTMYFCTIRLSTSCGMAETIVAAAICPQSTCSYEMNWIAPTVTGNVWRPASISG
jgi:hypothetical protein